MTNQNGRHLEDDSSKFVFVNENHFISIKDSLMSVSKDRIDNKSVLVYLNQWWPNLLILIDGIMHNWATVI